MWAQLMRWRLKPGKDTAGLREHLANHLVVLRLGQQLRVPMPIPPAVAVTQVLLQPFMTARSGAVWLEEATMLR